MLQYLAARGRGRGANDFAELVVCSVIHSVILTFGPFGSLSRTFRKHRREFLGKFDENNEKPQNEKNV